MSTPEDSMTGAYLMLSSVDRRLGDLGRDVGKLVDGLNAKANVTDVKEIEDRLAVVERNSASEEAVAAVLKSLRTSRRAFWAAVGIAVLGWVPTAITLALQK